jgi:hypothetical protein
MKAIFRFKLQYRLNDEEYNLSEVPPMDTPIAINGVWWVLKGISWVADADKKDCYPILWLESTRDLTEDETKGLANTQE